MLSYTYTCRTCRSLFEKEQKITDEPRSHCPNCGADDCVRLMQPSNFQLKGTGWYATDYKARENSSSEKR